MLSTRGDTRHTERDRLSIVLAVMLASATLFRFIELPTLAWGLRQILGSPLNLSFGGDWLLAILMMGLAATGTFSLLQNHPLFETRERSLLYCLITPTLGTLLISLLLIRAPTWPVWLVTLLIGGVLIGLLIHLSYRAISPESSGYTSARTMLNIADYLLGFALLSIIMQAQGRALVTGPAILLVCGLLAFDLLSASSVSGNAVTLFGSIIALLEGEIGWVLGYWPISAWTAATMLTLGLYLLNGLSYQYILEKLTRKVLLEFGIVALLMFILVLWIRP